MGILDRIRKRFSREAVVTSAEETFVLKRQNPDGRGMIKVMDLADAVELDQIYESLEPGRYALDSYTKGKSGFDRLWTGDVEGEERAPRRVRTAAEERPTSRLRGMLQELKDTKQDIEEVGSLFKDVFAGGSGEQKGIVDQLIEAKGEWEKLGTLFGSPTTQQNEPPKYEGTLPMWFHPDVVPRLVDGTLNSIESRMRSWGLIEGSGDTIPDEEIIKLPKKPAPKSQETETEAEDEETESETNA